MLCRYYLILCFRRLYALENSGWPTILKHCVGRGEEGWGQLEGLHPSSCLQFLQSYVGAALETVNFHEKYVFIEHFHINCVVIFLLLLFFVVVVFFFFCLTVGDYMHETEILLASLNCTYIRMRDFFLEKKRKKSFKRFISKLIN